MNKLAITEIMKCYLIRLCEKASITWRDFYLLNNEHINVNNNDDDRHA